jgi:hypothetical protein
MKREGITTLNTEIAPIDLSAIESIEWSDPTKLNKGEVNKIIEISENPDFDEFIFRGLENYLHEDGDVSEEFDNEMYLAHTVKSGFIKMMQDEKSNFDLKDIALDIVLANIENIHIPPFNEKLKKAKNNYGRILETDIGILFNAYDQARVPLERQVVKRAILSNIDGILSYFNHSDNSECIRNYSAYVASGIIPNLENFLTSLELTPEDIHLYKQIVFKLLTNPDIDQISVVLNIINSKKMSSFSGVNKLLYGDLCRYYGLKEEELDDLLVIWKNNPTDWYQSPTDIMERQQVKISDALKAMNYLEYVSPGSVHTNYHTCGIRNFERYSSDYLIEQGVALQTPEGMESYISEIDQLYVGPHHDHNGAWGGLRIGRSTGNDAMLNEGIKNGVFNEYTREQKLPDKKLFIEVGSFSEFSNQLRTINKIKISNPVAKSLRFLEIGAHSNTEGMYFSDKNHFSRSELDNLSIQDINEMSSCWSQDMVVLLRGCSIGGRVSKSFAAEFAKKFKSVVYAPRLIASIDYFEPVNDDDILILPRLKYKGKTNFEYYISQKLKKYIPKITEIGRTRDMDIYYGEGVI